MIVPQASGVQNLPDSYLWIYVGVPELVPPLANTNVGEMQTYFHTRMVFRLKTKMFVAYKERRASDCTDKLIG
jgi:hypothetical protein